MDTKTIVKDITNGLELLENQSNRNLVINNYNRFKTKTPFSPTLNNYIEEWFETYKNVFVFTDTDDFDENDIEGTLEKHIQRFKDTGKIHVWTGESDGTIFGDATINHKFRAWHDYIHVTLGYGYDFIGESIVASIQASQLPSEWVFEKELVLCEVVGQAQYFMQHNEFLKDQRKFTVTYLQSPFEALRVKQL